MNTRNKTSLNSLLFVITILFLSSSFSALAQQTAYYNNPQKQYATAMDLFTQEKYAAAKELFDDCIANDENGADKMNASYYSAVCSEKLQQPDAETLFLNLCDDYPSNSITQLAQFHLGNIYYTQKKFDKAIAAYAKVDLFDLTDNEKKTDYKFRFGYCYFSKQDYTKALPFFEQVKDLESPYYLSANYYYAYICYTKKNYNDALSSFKLLEGSKQYAAVLPYYISNIYFLQKKYQQAIEYAEPKLNDAALSYKSELQQLVGKSYFNLENYQAALPLLSSWFKTSTLNTKGDIYQIAYCQYMTGKYDDASYNFLQLNSQTDSIGQNALYMLGNCYMKMNQKEKARNAFQSAAKFSFDKFISENAAFNFAKLNVELGYNDLAISTLQNFSSTFPTSSHNTEAKELLTQVFLNTNNYVEALKVIETINPKSADIKKAYQKVAFARGVQLYQSGNIPGAVKLFDESLLNTVDDGITAQCYFWKGECFFEKKNYTEAIKNHLKFLDLCKLNPSLPATVNKACSDYTLGYCYYKLNNYTLAQTYFDNARLIMKSPSTDLEQKKQYADLLPDDLLRLADCLFILKQNEKAWNYYSEVINNKYPGDDYATYQNAIISGLQGDNATKIALLKIFNTNYQSSIYIDDALFELGNTYLISADYNNAIPVFQKITKSFSESPFAPKSFNKLGLIYFNQGNNDQAQSNYQTVLTNYSQCPDVNDAVKGLKEIYIDKGDPQGFLNLMNGLPNVNITSQETDSLLYRSGENKFVKGDCDGATTDFTSYLTQFPKGAFDLEAHFYRAECLFKNEDYTKALTDYQFVNDAGNNRFTEKSFLQTARIEYTTLKDYQKAYNAYSDLLTAASFKSNAFEAQQGMMYCAWNLKQNENVLTAAQLVMNNELASDDDKLQAHYYMAKVLLAQNKINDAQTEFDLVAKANHGDMSAEAGYELAHIYYLKNDTANSMKQCDAIFNNPPENNYWLAKTYLLVAQMQFDAADYFQSRSTLESIISGYTVDDDILPAANELLNKVQKKEDEQNKVLDENQLQQMPVDSTNNINPNH